MSASAGPSSWREHLELDVLADDVPQLAEQVVGAEAGQQAAVDLDLDLRRDDVQGGAAADDGRVDGVPQRPFERPALLADQP